MSRRAETAYRCGLIEGIILITALAGDNTEQPLTYRDLRLYSVDYQRGEGVKNVRAPSPALVRVNTPSRSLSLSYRRDKTLSQYGSLPSVVL